MNVFIKYSMLLYMYIYGTVHTVSANKIYLSLSLSIISTLLICFVHLQKGKVFGAQTVRDKNVIDASCYWLKEDELIAYERPLIELNMSLQLGVLWWQTIHIFL